MNLNCYMAASALAFSLFAAACPAATLYTWLDEYDEKNSIEARIPAPDGYERIEADEGSFGEWLRNLPLKKGRPDVLLHDGRKKRNQKAHYAVVNIDVGERDLQQCADAVMRLRAEYLFSKKDYGNIHFNFASGHAASFSRWAEGYRPKISGDEVTWSKTGKEDDYSHKSFRGFMNIVFAYANSYSLAKELVSVGKTRDMEIGDVFIRGGFPGHVAIVVDVAAETTSGKKVFLLAQSYMPAQDIHVLRNPANDDDNPWYDADFGEKLITPEFVFTAKELMRFSEADK